METARIFDVHRMATGDGPGMRTVLFLKGCPLECVWCQNPESISMRPEVWWWEKKCIACGECAKACPLDCLSLADSGVKIDRSVCDGCGRCVEACPSMALELLGKEWSLDEALRLLLRDKPFYDGSGGGVTLSGGEPTMQAEFVEALARRLREAGVHVALDTCGMARFEIFERLLPRIDLLLWDVKAIDPERHRRWTGASNELVFDNLRRVAEGIRRDGHPKLWIRTPLIPGLSAEMENVRAIARFIDENLADVSERWELCAFNRGCAPKYRRLGREWALAETPSMRESDLLPLREILAEHPRLREKTRFTGVIRKDAGPAA